MKKLIMIVIVVVSFCSDTSHLFGQWMRTGKPNGIAPITFLYADDQVQVIGSPQFSWSAPLPYFSTDNGSVWDRQKVNISGLSSFFTNDSVWLMGTASGSYSSIHISTDRGIMWKQQSFLTGGSMVAVAQNKRTIVCSNGQKIFITTNNGEKWLDAYYGANSISISDDLTLACDGSSIAYPVWDSADHMYFSTFSSPANPRHVVVVKSTIYCDNGTMVFRKNDGAKWDTLSLGMPAGLIRDLVKFRSEIYVVMQNAIFRFDDTMMRWKIFASLPDGMTSVAFNENIILAHTTYRLLRSTDKGRTWSDSIESATNFSGRIYQIDSALIYIENWRGVHVSTDEGETWLKRNTGLEGVLEFNEISIVSQYIFLTCNGGVYRSNDYGEHWEKLGIPASTITTFSESDSTLLAVVPAGGVFLSKDYGLHWIDRTQYINPAVATGFGLSGGVIDHGMILLAYFKNSPAEQGIFRSNDTGRTWEKISYKLPTASTRFRLLKYDNSFYAVGQKELFESADNGLQWTRILNQPTGNFTDGITDFYKNGSIMFLNTMLNDKNMMMMSKDAGRSWTSFQSNMDRDITVVNFIVHKGKLVASTGGDGIWTRDINQVLQVRQHRMQDVEYLLEQNYPNPFNPSTNIRYTLPVSGMVKLTVSDVIGIEHLTLVNEHQEQGAHSVMLDLTGSLRNYSRVLPSGVYFYSLRINGWTQTKRMVILK